MAAERNPFLHLIPKKKTSGMDSEGNPFQHLIPQGNKSFLDKAGDVAGMFNEGFEKTRLPAFAGGALQGAGNLGTSIANIPLELIGKALGKNAKISRPDLEQYLPHDALSQAAFKGGEFVPEILTGRAAANIIGKGAGTVLEKLMGSSKGLGRIPYVGKGLARGTEGALSGYALGEDEKGDREMSALLGGIANPLFSAGKYIKNLLPKGLAAGVVGAKKAAKDKYEKLYNGLFNEAKTRGLNQNPITVPKFDIDLIKKHSQTKYHGGLNDFVKDPNLETAHRAQSDIGKFIRHMKEVDDKTGLTSSQLKALKEAEKAQKKIKGSIFTRLTQGGKQDLSNKYGNITKGYAKDVIPYDRNKNITALQNKKISDKTFADRILKDEEFRMAMQKQHPELRDADNMRRFVRSIPWKYIVGAATGSAIGVGGYNAVKNFSED